MKPFLLMTFGILLIQSTAHARNCDQEREQLRAEVERTHHLNTLRKVTVAVNSTLSPSEVSELLEMSKRFNAIPHDTPEHQNERFELQKKARIQVRVATARAGYPILNPLVSPYDALIKRKFSEDGIEEVSIEVRDLLVLPVPLPHVTVWLHRMDPAHNPLRIITLSVMQNAAEDSASWASADGLRVVGTFEQFLQARLPSDCEP